ncbi:MAG: hypothetical protein M0T73_11525 [Deltaproteobacteria bacterium]|nr:hypothetical protein [Deltaproteobacteria bacterium]
MILRCGPFTTGPVRLPLDAGENPLPHSDLLYHIRSCQTGQVKDCRQYEPMSFEKIRNELLHAQASILMDTATNRKYIMPSKITDVQ